MCQLNIESDQIDNSDKLNKTLIAMSVKDFDQFMVAKFPGIFSNRFKPMSETCMCWGFEIGPGWHAIIHNLCQKLDLIGNLIGFTVVASQVKEKYRSLRFYYDIIDNPKVTNVCRTNEEKRLAVEIVEDMVDAAEERSKRTCEVCGEYGECHSLAGWYTTLCNQHFQERASKIHVPPQ